jgi:hypothetical protein
MTYKNGDIYKGSFLNGKRHGEGFLMTKKGIKMCQWKDNEQDGEQKEVKYDELENGDLKSGDIENGGELHDQNFNKDKNGPL